MFRKEKYRCLRLCLKKELHFTQCERNSSPDLPWVVRLERKKGQEEALRTAEQKRGSVFSWGCPSFEGSTMYSDHP